MIRFRFGLFVAAILLSTPEAGGQEPAPADPPPATGEAQTPFRVEFLGNRALSDRRLQGILKGPEFQAYSIYLVEDLKEAAADLYLEKGFANVEVEGRESPDPGGTGRLLTIEIREGEKFRVHEVRIEGNEAFEDDALRVYLKQAPRLFSPPFDRVEVRADSQRIEKYYIGHGYLDVEVTHREELFAEEGDAVVIHTVTEGRQYHLARVTFSGQEILSATDLLGIAGLKPGGHYDPAQAGAARLRIEDFYQDSGHAYARVESNAEIRPASAEAVLHYTVFEGPQVYIEGIHLEGNRLTRDRVIWRKVDLRSGDLYSRSRLYEARKKIYSTGLFSAVDVRAATDLVGQTRTDLVIEVEETPPGRLRLGVGYGTEEGYRFSAEASYINLWGLGHEIGARGEFTGIGNQEEIYYRIRHVFGTDVDMRTRVFRQDKEEPSFTVHRFGGGFEFQKPFGEIWLGRMEYSLEDIQLSDVDIEQGIDDFDEHEGLLSKLAWTAIRDTRDIPSNPHRGMISEFRYTLGGSLLGGEFDFHKFEASHALFIPVTRNTTLALNAEAGYITPFGRSSESLIPERFFLGGPNTIRGFERDRVGPRDADGEFIGGDAKLLFNVEYRFPLYKALGGAVFFDTGNAWRDLSDLDITDLREGTGVGLRYVLPVGAIRFDVGRNLDPILDEEDWEFYLSIGYGF